MSKEPQVLSLRPAAITFDCENAVNVAQFWSEALGRPLDPDPSENFASIGMGGGTQTGWMFCRVPEPKTAKNRCHIDLAGDGNPDAAIARLVDLGAMRGDDKDEWGHSWTVMTDPEGNEFCVSRM